MKKGVLLTAALALTLACAAGAMAEETAYIPGTYESEAEGFGGPVKVALTVSDKEITDLTITGDGETPSIGGDALPKLREQLLSAQSQEIDGVSGASITSGAVKEAAAAVFALARGEELPKAEVQVPDGVVLGENEYYGEDANGANGLISVKVTVVDGVIQAIKVLEQHETPGLGTTALLKLTDTMVKQNTVEVDSVAGATLSSSAFKRAVKQAVDQAVQP